MTVEPWMDRRRKAISTAVLGGTWVRDIARQVEQIVEHVSAWLWTRTRRPQRCPQRCLGTCREIHRWGWVFNRHSPAFQQGFTSSISQGLWCRMGSVNQLTPNGSEDQIAIRLRSVGRLADRLEAGADRVYVVDVARAIVDSCSNVTESEESMGEQQSSDLGEVSDGRLTNQEGDPSHAR